MKILNSHQHLSDHAVGGKFAKQSAMIKAGIPVPEFFCLSKAFYESVWVGVEENVKAKLNQIDFSDQKSIKKIAGEIEDIFNGIQLSAEDKALILEQFDAHFDSSSLVSVRASTVGKKIEESEDSADNPFAGMSESFLYVPRDQVIEKVKQCWASGFSEESLMYRYAQGFDLTGFSVAVGIQRMVMGTKSFVMFTCDPKTAAKDSVIVGGYGIGEGVVQESVPVDHYFVSAKGGDITRDIAKKDSQLTLDASKGHGLIKALVPQDLQNQSCLSDAEIARMVELGDKIESLFGCPQDTEGCFTEDGKSYFLQSRPIALDYTRQLVFSNANVTESFPGVTTALTYTFAK
ncbi:MAG: PEP/pyruvate-binding domain-containing protein, partial [Anaerolineales bacterium]